MDKATRNLRRVLLEREALRARMRASDRELTVALREWSDRRPGHRGGIASEATALAALRHVGAL